MIKHQHKDSVTFIPRAQLRRRWATQLQQHAMPIFEDWQSIYVTFIPIVQLCRIAWAAHVAEDGLPIF